MISYKSTQYSVPPEYIGKRLKLQVYNDQLHVYYNTKLVIIHNIQNKKLNYHLEHYAEISGLTFSKNSYEIMEIAKQNLDLIGDVYKNE